MLRILGLCVFAALICAMLRTVHPQIAAAVALAAGVAALMLSTEHFGALSGAVEHLQQYSDDAGVHSVQIMKICGIAMVAEFASDICRDSGETALARRIDSGVKIGIAASALPAIVDIMDLIAELLK